MTHHRIPAPALTALIWRLLIALVFAAAGIAKIADPTSFLAAVLSYHLPLSALILKWVALVVPWLELLSGLCGDLGLLMDAALVAASGLSIVFVAVALQAALRGLSIQCGCFGSLSERMPAFMSALPFVLGRDALLAAATITLAWKHLGCRKPVSAGTIDSSSGGPQGPS